MLTGIWSKKWLLPFNAPKCKVMHLGRCSPEQAYSFDGGEIQMVMVERDLGVLVGAQLKFQEQAAAVIPKASQMLTIIK